MPLQLQNGYVLTNTDLWNLKTALSQVEQPYTPVVPPPQPPLPATPLPPPPPPPQPPQPRSDPLWRIKAAPSRWAAYWFATVEEWGQLTALYGVDQVNQVKQFFHENWRLNGIMRPNGQGGYAYSFEWPPGSPAQVDHGQADAAISSFAHGLSCPGTPAK